MAASQRRRETGERDDILNWSERTMPIREPLSAVVLDVDAGELQPRRDAILLEDPADRPFRILVLGNFSGRDARSPDAALAGRTPKRIDRDNFEQVLSMLEPELNLRLGSGPETIKLTFRELEDFEPDSIVKRCALFQTPASPVAKPHAPPPVTAVGESDAVRLSSGSLLDDIIEQASTPASRPHPKSEFQSIVDRLVAPHLVPPEDQDAVEARLRSGEARTMMMRAILHHPEFQALEAAWRSLFFLVRGLDTDGGLSLHVLDLSKDEFAEDLSADDPRATSMFRLLVEETRGTLGGQPWSVIAANYAFDRSADEVKLLGAAATLARLADAPFLAESIPPGGDADDGTAWSLLRALPEAHWVGLSLPRFLLRLPYGSATSTVESFPFEEIAGRPEHRNYLWGNPAFACAYLLGSSFNEHGWGFRPGVTRKIDGVPLHTVEIDGEMHAQPCAEVLLTDREIDTILEEGLMALASMKNRDAVMLVRFQSIADPLAPLAGPWTA
jgi:type VI secretion system protein ImpC